jgi:hypothetical protein
MASTIFWVGWAVSNVGFEIWCSVGRKNTHGDLFLGVCGALCGLVRRYRGNIMMSYALIPSIYCS